MVYTDSHTLSNNDIKLEHAILYSTNILLHSLMYCTRLSASASAMLTYDNPNIADLSDMNRPTKLAEQFSELYDNEWTDGFGALLDSYQGNKTEKEMCDILLSVLVVS